MKYLVFIASILIVFSACGPKTETNQATGPANPPTVNASQPNSNTVTASNSNPVVMQPYNGVQNLNPNAFNASNDNLKTIKYQPKPDELPYGSRNAPDDSVISSASRGRDFVETRTFRSDPVLSKVEKIMDGKTTKYKVYLKSGKTFDAPAEKMSNMEALAPANILDAIGMRPKPATDSPAKPEEKKDQKQ